MDTRVIKVNYMLHDWVVSLNSHAGILAIKLQLFLSDSHKLRLNGTRQLRMLAISEAFPLHSQFYLQESRLLWNHFLKLSLFLFGVQKSLDHPTMCPIVTGRSTRIKEVINQFRAFGDNTALYREDSVVTQHWAAGREPQYWFLMQQLTTWNQNNCTEMDT